MSSKSTTNQQLLCLDVGEKRIGVARADSAVRIAVACGVIEVDGAEVDHIRRQIVDDKIACVVVGYPRNQSGEPTEQTTRVEAFVERLRPVAAKIVYQDESVTSVRAEEILIARKKPYAKGDIDTLAASLILQDYIEATYGRI